MRCWVTTPPVAPTPAEASAAVPNIAAEASERASIRTVIVVVSKVVEEEEEEETVPSGDDDEDVVVVVENELKLTIIVDWITDFITSPPV